MTTQHTVESLMALAHIYVNAVRFRNPDDIIQKSNEFQAALTEVFDALAEVKRVKSSLESEIVKRIDEYEARLDEQLRTITALNDIVGGEGSQTTDNITRVSRLEEDNADLAMLADQYKAERNTLQSKCESQAREIERLKEANEDVNRRGVAYLVERDTALAKIAAMESQEPVNTWPSNLTPLDEWVGRLYDGFSKLINDAEARSDFHSGAFEKSMRDSFAALMRQLAPGAAPKEPSIAIQIADALANGMKFSTVPPSAAPKGSEG